MAELVFKESEYRFTSPIRFFKENDPYYWEVDNIPLKQLHENELWLKDQFENAVTLTNVERSDLAELKPYVNGSDNKLRVKPGRYTARINDAYELKPLQEVIRVLGRALGTPTIWRILTYGSSTVQGYVEGLKSNDGLAAYFMNGLAERVFAYPTVSNEDALENYRGDDNPNAPQDVVPTASRAFLQAPFDKGHWWLNWHDITETRDIFSYQTWNSTVGHEQMNIAEQSLTKMWRGPARTAIVDVPYELEIEIPSFNSKDFSYVDADGNVVENSKLPVPESRIDLVYIYSKPVDTSSVTINKNKTPTKITTPELGVLRGAGALLSYDEENAKTSLYDSDGNPRMHAHAADANNTDNGFLASSVHGSFPAPDDLLNIAPLLSDQLETDDPALVGQSILPVAYIIVNSNAVVDAQGNQILTEGNIIDIRPFFRTAELSYNERAGIAAANPPLSIANHAIGRAELDYEMHQLTNAFNSRISEDITENTTNKPRVVGAGYVLGGMNFGPEGALGDYYKTHVDTGASDSRLKQLVAENMGLAGSVQIPDYPDWSVAKWVGNRTEGRGTYPNDYINTFFTHESDVQFGCKKNAALDEKVRRFGDDNWQGKQGHVTIHFVSKDIYIDRGSVEWMEDYLVNVKLLNCIPLTSRTVSHNQNFHGGASHVWVEKQTNKFTIYAAWIANDVIQTGNNSEHQTLAGPADRKLPIYNRDNGEAYAGWAVLTHNIINNQIQESVSFFDDGVGSDPYASVAGGVSIYPSLTFEIVGIPRNYGLFSSGNNPSDTLKLV